MAIITETTKKLSEKLDGRNVHAVPRIKQVVVSVGVGKHRGEKAYLEAVRRDLAAITGQTPHERLARKSVAGFNVREGQLVAYRVTLRGTLMNDFVTRFVNITLPRVRDFRGIRLSSLDGHGNLSVGLTEQLAFPEIHPEETDVLFGVQATFTTTATSDEEGEVLFRALGFPLVEAAAVTDPEVDIRQGKKEDS